MGETADWILNDVHNSALEPKDVFQAFANAMTQTEVLEGQNGGGAGMTCHMFPGGTGTSSRVVNDKYTVGVLCQSNYGHVGDLQIGGVPIGKLLLKQDQNFVKTKPAAALGGKADDGSIVIILM